MTEEKKYPKGKNPKSLANLTGEGGGRPIKYEVKKKTHEVTVTPSAWDEAKAIAAERGCDGISDLIEKIGRREILLQ